MGRVAVILRFQWRAYWRRFKRSGNLTTNNAGIWILFGGIGVFKYLQQLPGVSTQLARSETTRYETLLAAVFLVWMLPVMAESWRSISSRALLHTPLTPRELFFIRLGSVFVSPVTWVIGVCSLALVYPIAKSPHPLTGLGALILFLLFSLAMSLAIAHVLSSAQARKLLLALLAGLSVVLGTIWIAKGNVSTLALWPNQLVARAAVESKPLGPLAVLLVMTIAAFGLSFWTFTRGLQYAGNRRSQRFSPLGLIHFPGRFGGLIKKDLRYFTRLLDGYFILPIVILFLVYLLTNSNPDAATVGVVLVIFYLPLISLASNCFGLDSALGLDRYTLFPLSGRDILLSKNLAFAMLLTILLGGIFPFAFWRFGAGTAALGFIEVMLVGLAYLAWGNWMSVRDVYKMQFYRFSSGGSPADAIIGMLFGSLPGLIMVYVLYRENSGASWKITLMIILYLMLYYLSVTQSGRRLEAQREEIRGFL